MIQDLPGVEVAAPIANVGYLMPFSNRLLSINQLLDTAPYQLYRIRETWTANGGLSRYPAGTSYIYFSTRDVLEPDRGFVHGSQQVAGHKRALPTCGSLFDESVPAA